MPIHARRMPRVGEYVYSEDKEDNGRITKVDTFENEVHVIYFVDGGADVIDLDEFYHNWTDKFDGLWRVP